MFLSLPEIPMPEGTKGDISPGLLRNLRPTNTGSTTMKRFLMIAIWFMFGFVTQRSIIKVSEIAKGLDGIECTQISTKVDVVLTCYAFKQSEPGRVIVNALNPSSDLFDKWFANIVHILMYMVPSETEKNDHSGDKEV